MDYCFKHHWMGYLRPGSIGACGGRMNKVTITKGTRLSMLDLDVSQGHISLHNVKYGGEAALSVDLDPLEVVRVIAALQGDKGDEIARATIAELLKPAVRRMVEDIQ